MYRMESEDLSNAEMKVKEDLESILHHEELLWKQKVRCNWLVMRDRDTKFFHRHTLQRRKHNKISTPKNDLGDWVYDDDVLQIEAINFF